MGDIVLFDLAAILGPAVSNENYYVECYVTKVDSTNEIITFPFMRSEDLCGLLTDTNKILLYPNPTSSYITLQLGSFYAANCNVIDGYYEIYDENGVLLHTEQADLINGNMIDMTPFVNMNPNSSSSGVRGVQRSRTTVGSVAIPFILKAIMHKNYKPYEEINLFFWFD